MKILSYLIIFEFIFSGLLPLSSLSLIPDAKAGKHKTEYETNNTCGPEGGKPKNGDNNNCCEGLQWDNSKQVCAKVSYPRKKCDEGQHNSCNPGQSCLASEFQDLYPDEEQYDEEIDKVEEEMENGVGVLKPRDVGEKCFSDKQCFTMNCISKKNNHKKKKGISKWLTKIITTITFSRRCEPIFVCRCAESGEKPVGNGQCCEGMKKDPSGKCVSEEAFDLLYGNYNSASDHMELMPETCSVNINPLKQYHYISNTFKMRGFEYLTANSDVSDCLGFADKMEKLGDKMIQKRKELSAEFHKAMNQNIQERNELVNTKYSKHRSMASGNQKYVAEDRVTGKDMLELLKNQQLIYMKYEQGLNALYKEVHNELSTLTDEWKNTNPKTKHGKKCRSQWWKQKKKRAWQYRYKIKSRYSGNSEVFLNPRIKSVVEELGGSTRNNRRYFLTDPLLPKSKNFKSYGGKTWFAASGKWRRKMKPTGRKTEASGFEAGLQMFYTGAKGSGFTGIMLQNQAEAAKDKLSQWLARSLKAQSKESEKLSGMHKHLLQGMLSYYNDGQLQGDIELGINMKCLATNLQEDSSFTYMDNNQYVDNEDDGIDRTISSEEEQEENEIVYDEDINEFEDENIIDDNEIEYEAGIRNDNDVNGKTLVNNACVKTAFVLAEIQNIAFSQLWMYGYQKKRKYGFGEDHRYKMLASNRKALKDMEEYLTELSGNPGSDAGGLRGQSITCLDERIKEFNDWDGDGGIAAGADNYEQQRNEKEWQKSKQADLDCKNCNLTGQAAGVDINIPGTNSATILANKIGGNLGSDLFSSGKTDWANINNKYAIMKKNLLDRDKDILDKHKKDRDQFMKLQTLVNESMGPSHAAMRKLGLTPPNSETSNDSSNLTSANASALSSSSDSEKDKSNSSDKNSSLAGSGNSTSAQDNGSNASGSSAADQLKNMYSEFGSDYDSDEDEAEKKISKYTGLKRKERSQMLKAISENKKKYESQTGDSLFEKVSKAYVRSAYPSFMSRKVRKPASEEKKNINQELVDKLNNFSTK